MMTSKLLTTLILRRQSFRCCTTSSLYFYNRSQHVRPVLSPTLDLKSKFSEIEKLDANIKSRNLKMDANGLKNLWEVYKELDSTRIKLEKHRTKVAAEMKALKKGDESKKETERLRLLGRVIREDLKHHMEIFWEIEENLMVECLSLPNDLHPDTPLSVEKVIAEFGSRPLLSSNSNESHLDLGKDLIDYRSPQWYYLVKEAASFDLSLMYYFNDAFISDGFVPIIPPDFVADSVVEACGTPPSNSIRLASNERKIHLVGGSSLNMFCAYYAKQKIAGDQLMAKHVSSGRKYHISDSPGLFGAWQRTCVDIFTISSNSKDLEEEYQKTLTKVSNLYKALNWEIKVKYLPAPDLKFWESSRISFQMFAPSLNCWLEVGHLSLSGTFLSERLSMEYELKNKEKGFVHVLSGTVVDVTAILACVMEQNVDLFPHVLKRSTFVTDVIL